MKKILSIFVLVFLSHYLIAQKDSLVNKFSLEADFRFRLEQDWDSRRPDGTFREDRSRMRYRARAGIGYQHNEWASFGLRLRTGDPKKQQDPQVTLGNENQESGTLPLALEKAFFQTKKNNWVLWLGKNTFPFKKNNELFWSDNVFPDGVFIRKTFPLKSGLLGEIDINGGHFILSATGSSFDKDSYFQGIQFNTNWLNKRLNFFPSFYYFNHLPDIPDGNEQFFIDYSIVHLGSKYKLFNQPHIELEFDYYQNLRNYDIPIMPSFQDEKQGWVAAIGVGQLKEKGNWHFKLTYTELQRFSAVDFLAQNDWARWDYSSFGSPDGRLTNMKGIEAVAAYLLDKNLSLRVKYYWVEQLVATGIENETNQRIRFDIDINFNHSPKTKVKID